MVTYGVCPTLENCQDFWWVTPRVPRADPLVSTR